MESRNSLYAEAKRMFVEDGMSLREISLYTGLSPQKLGKVSDAENWRHERRVWLSERYRGEGEGEPKAAAQAQELGDIFERTLRLLKRKLEELELRGVEGLDSKMITSFVNLLQKVEEMEARRAAIADLTGAKATKDIANISVEQFSELYRQMMEKSN